MTRRTQSPFLLPFMVAELAIDACDTIASRARLIATGQCSPAEFQLMFLEKAQAAQASLLAVANATPLSAWEAALTPWARGARANAKRLRRNS